VTAIVNTEWAPEVAREWPRVFESAFRVVPVHEVIVREVNVASAVHVEDLDEVCGILPDFAMWSDRKRRILLVENIGSLLDVRCGRG